ncbi:MAG TPA: hypothetical protein VKV32_07300 [Stellaceae bacterium]|nr:hypothetical protein [Stellaceae bacterium]
MRQLPRMRGHWPSWIVAVALSGCSILPAPYQTYAPADAPAAAAAAKTTPPPQALVVYGATTTTPDMTPDSLENMTLSENEEEPGLNLTPAPNNAPMPSPAPVPSPVPSNPQASPLNPQRVAICYNRLWNKPDAIKSAATQACGNSPAQIESQGTDLEACPLLTPTRAVFSCSASTLR